MTKANRKNNRAKGKLHEKRVADYLETLGYKTERGFGKPGYIPGRGIIFCARDLFGFVDVIAIREPGEVRLIQVTCGDASPRKKLSFEAWSQSEVWQHVRGGVYRIYRKDQPEEAVDIKGGSQ